MPYSKTVEEGYVSSVARFAQSKNMCFRNLKFRRGIRPTDIDFAFDLNGNVFFEGEGKLEGKKMDVGQEKHFENKAKRLKMRGAEVYIIEFEHNVTDTSQIIYVDECLVTRVYTSEELKWKKIKKKITVLECISQIIKHCEETLNI